MIKDCAGILDFKQGRGDLGVAIDVDDSDGLGVDGGRGYSITPYTPPHSTCMGHPSSI